MREIVNQGHLKIGTGIQGNDCFLSAPTGSLDLVDQSVCGEVFALCVTPVSSPGILLLV